MIRRGLFFSPQGGGGGLTDFMISHYKMNGNSNDAIGANNGTDNNVTYPTTAPLIEANKLYLGAGNDAKIIIPASSDFDFWSGNDDLPFTISLWQNFHASGVNYRMVNRRNPIPGVVNSFYADLQFEAWFFANRLRLTLFTDNSNYISGITTFISSSIVVGKWYHFVFTYDGSKTASGIQIYIDGVAGNKDTLQGGTYTGIRKNTYPMSIGSDTYYNASYHNNGYIDELTFWNKELSQEEVTEIYNKGLNNESLVP